MSRPVASLVPPMPAPEISPPASLSVVVVNHNGAATLRPVFAAVRALTGVRAGEVLLADNASTDDSTTLVRAAFPEVRIVALPDNRGPNPARNAGLREATGDLVLVLDNDIVPAPDYAARLAAVFQQDPRAGAATGRIRLGDPAGPVQYNGLMLHYAGEIALRPPDEPGTVRVPCTAAGAVLLDRRAALAVGGFDEAFVFGWEDGDLTYRLSLAGYPCYRVAEAEACHLRRGRGTAWIRLQTRNRWWFLMKNYERRTFWLALPAVLALQAGAGCVCVARGRGGAFLRGTWEALVSVPALRARRRAVQRLRRVPDIDLLQGDRLDLPGGLGATGLGRRLNAAVNSVLRAYWRLIRPALRRRGGALSGPPS